MKNNGNVKIAGIKCDNPKCTYRNDSVSFDDYHLWLNKPCPLCGQNLLTEKDYKFCKRLMFLANLLPAAKQGAPRSKVSFHLHGEGSNKMEIEVQNYDN